MFVVMIASAAESRHARKRLTGRAREVKSGALFLRGTLGGQVLTLVETGVGARKAGSAARQVIGSGRAGCVLSIGAAGAADPALNIGDVVVVGRIISGRGETLRCHTELSRKAIAALNAAGLRAGPGDCCEVGRFVHRKEDKQSIHVQCGARVVDMESAAAARIILPAGVPFVDVRVVSDTARDDTLDLVGLYRLRRKAGRAGAWAHFLKNPADVLRAARLQKDLARVSRLIALSAEVLAGVLSGGCRG